MVTTTQYQWYIMYTLSGSEKRIKDEILERAKKQKLSDLFEDIVIPVIQVSAVKHGKHVSEDKKFMPGYMLIKMKMTNESWYLVKSVPKVSSFLGSGGKPQAVSEQEVHDILDRLKSQAQDMSSADLYEVGERVEILIHESFDSFVGTIEEVDSEKKRLKVSVLILGRSTPLDLSFSQVKKV